MKVLVVEDEPDIRDLLIDTLLDAGYEVIEAEDGEAALERAGSHCPDIILLDVMLPLLDGFQVLKKLKGDPATRLIPIIMVTAKGQEQDVYQAMRIGAQGYIIKPWGPNEVETKVMSAQRSLERR